MIFPDMRIRFALFTFVATIVLAPFESSLAEWSIAGELQAAASVLNDEQNTFITSGEALKFVPERQLEHELATRSSNDLRRFVDDLMSLAAQMAYDPQRDMGAAPLNLNATVLNMREAITIVRRLCAETNVVGFDLVELHPAPDPTYRTKAKEEAEQDTEE